MNGILKTKITDVPAEHKKDHEGYEFYKRTLVPHGLAKQCKISVYEIPPGKSGWGANI